MKKNYKHTMYASYVGYITQAIVNNLAPLLFLTFHKQFGISLEEISILVTLNFSTQMIIDFLAARFIDKIGYRVAIVSAHVFCGVGLIGLGIFPNMFSNHYAGIICAVVLYAVGGGLIEVLVSPIVESLPNDAKSSAMSLLHSFYCWGHVFVVVMSTLYFTTAGIENWRYLTILWAVIPLCNAVWFTRVPINTLEDNMEKQPLRKLFSLKIFWMFFILMICSGASEQAMSQWASAFAEAGLNFSKTMGDLFGPCMFAVLMGTSRAFYGKFGDKIDLKKFIFGSSILCIFSYLLSVFAPSPVLSLIGCGLCGLSVGIMWPGVFSLSSQYCPQGGTSMFAFLALAGDVGCFAGPSLVGFISSSGSSSNLKTGLLYAIVFPIIMLAGVYFLRADNS